MFVVCVVRDAQQSVGSRVEFRVRPRELLRQIGVQVDERPSHQVGAGHQDGAGSPFERRAIPPAQPRRTGRRWRGLGDRREVGGGARPSRAADEQAQTLAMSRHGHCGRGGGTRLGGVALGHDAEASPARR